MQITEQWILAHAPGPAVAKNGRALADAGSYAALRCTADEKTYWGECAGSARNPYYVSVDWSLSEREPVFSCSCPSPHFPCKHVLGLMYQLADGVPFVVGEPPSYVVKARTKREAELARSEARLKRTRRRDAAVKEKKLEWQLEGLDKAEKFTTELLASGLAALDELPAQSLERLAVELGNCDLPGARDILERAALCERRLRQEPERSRQYLAELLRELAALRAMIRAARAFLTEQRASGSYVLEDPVLYELLGGAWDADELRELGAYRRNARLVQLSFDVTFDEAKRAAFERAYWLELSKGDVVCTLNACADKEPHPYSGDTCPELLEAPVLYETPGKSCPRVWWDSVAAQPMTDEERAELPAFGAADLAAVLERAREQLKEPLLPPCVPVLVRVGTVGCIENELVLEGEDGARIALRDRTADGAELASVRRLASLPEPAAAGDAIFGRVFYDDAARRLCLHPYSLIRANGIVRLQF